MTRALSRRLGIRLLAGGGPRQWAARAMVIVGVALAVVSFLTCVAAFEVSFAQADRTAARAFTLAYEDEDADAYVTSRSLAFEDRVLLRVDVDPASVDVPLPPGLDRWPGVGEMIVSPAAAALLSVDSDFAALVPGEVVGTVGADGLRGPDELVVYRGVPRADQPSGGSAVTADDTGALDLDTAPPDGGQMLGLSLVVVMLVGFPVIAFLTVAARMSAAARRSRIGVLRFLGAPERLVRQITRLESVVLAVVGWLLGLAAFPVVNLIAAGSGILGATWFASDTALTPAAAAIAGAAVVGIAARTGGRVPEQGVATRASVRQVERQSRRSAWLLAPLAIGFVSLCGQVIAGAVRPAGTVPADLDLLMSGAVVVTAVGIVVALPVLVRASGAALASRGRSLSSRLGGARAAFEPHTNAGLVAGLALLVMALGVTIGQTRDARAVSTPTAEQVAVMVSANELPEDASSRLRDLVDDPLLVLTYGSVAGVQPSTVVVATCDDVARVLAGATALALPSCRDGELLVSEEATARADAGVGTSPLIAVLEPEGLTSGVLPTAVGSFLVEGGADVLLTVDPQPMLDAVDSGPTRTDDGATTYSVDTELVFMVPREEVTATLARIYTVAPYSQPSAVGLDPASGQNIAMVNGFIRLGLILALAMTAAALATALLDRAVSRRRADHELLLVGTPRALVRAAHRWEVATSLASGVGIGLVAGILGGLAWQYAGGLVRTPDWGATIGLVVVTALAVGAIAWCASLSVPREIDSELVRTP